MQPDPTTAAAILRRKEEHLDIILAGHGQAAIPNGFEAIDFEHSALPELDYASIDLGSRFLGMTLRAPLLISAMTGGPARAERVNIHLAEAAQALGIALAVGSQRAALEAGRQPEEPALRAYAPDVPIFANLGAAQLGLGYGVEEARRAIDLIGADALVIHLNPLQEAVQRHGDRDWRGLTARIADLARALERPLIVKETGAGISQQVATRLIDCGVAAIDVAGAGGTNWALVEGARGADPAHRQLAAAFAGWGIPTAESLRAVRAASPTLPIIASGGIRDGVEVAKAIRLGAGLVGQAAGVLGAAMISAEAVVAHLSLLIEQLRIACFCTGSADLTALAAAPLRPPKPQR